ncbi:MAG: hypothetical protein JNL98_36220 [Bryobacterales bacterium]|nr:hypothetical protein [Bryobacterales bacterium]
MPVDSIEVARFEPYANAVIPCDPQVNVLIGANNCGKALFRDELGWLP